ncbi:hypothetical protein BHE74_00054329 [Ensete ventricosum]|uniref:Uncharacterized protein n=1 Tax=Ensete ventricosum TaxID=4639 RepID=A0A426ZR82_ENSVE|nr:hypothetical protein B296_00040184 [Ensete ventricosum]RWW40272.1 hypothetical protein BHE74_00054329 [Ensete ventricosum]
MKATLTGKYETDKDGGKASTILSVNTNVGDAKLKASVTNALVVNTASYSPTKLSFTLEKPDSFSVVYSSKHDANLRSDDPPDVKFKFMNAIKVMEKTVELQYTHELRDKKTAVEGSVALNPRNKVAVSHVLGSRDYKVQYKYEHGERRRTVVEPSYEVAANAWGLDVSSKFEGGDAVKASYRTAAKTVELEWSRNSKVNGTFKVRVLHGPSSQATLLDHISQIINNPLTSLV